MSIYSDLTKNFPTLKIEKDHPIGPHTSFKVGGNGDVAAFPHTKELFAQLVGYLNGRYPYCVIGRGTNLLVSDKGFRGAVIFTTLLSDADVKGNLIVADAGAPVKKLCKMAADNNLGGLEFAVGIPGSIGGLVAMNGGCFNKTISEVVCYVKGENGVYNNKLCDFGYRNSRFLSGEVILSVGLKLKISEEDLIRQKTERFTTVRQKTQPKGATAGSVFLNQGFFAGKVIDQAGLKGYKIGGAKISPKHGNFIINEGQSAQDIYDLICYVKETVYAKSGIRLNEEIRYIGEF